MGPFTSLEIPLCTALNRYWWWPSTLGFEEVLEDWRWWLIAPDPEEGPEEPLGDTVSRARVHLAMYAITADESDGTVRRIQAFLDLIEAGGDSPDTRWVPTDYRNENNGDFEEPPLDWRPDWRGCLDPDSLPFEDDSSMSEDEV